MSYLSDHSCLRVSESSTHAEREGLPSKSLEMVMLEADTITPPPKFRAPNVSQLSSLSYDSPKPKSGIFKTQWYFLVHIYLVRIENSLFHLVIVFFLISVCFVMRKLVKCLLKALFYLKIVRQVLLIQWYNSYKYNYKLFNFENKSML